MNLNKTLVVSVMLFFSVATSAKCIDVPIGLFKKIGKNKYFVSVSAFDKNEGYILITKEGFKTDQKIIFTFENADSAKVELTNHLTGEIRTFSKMQLKQTDRFAKEGAKRYETNLKKKKAENERLNQEHIRYNKKQAEIQAAFEAKEKLERETAQKNLEKNKTNVEGVLSEIKCQKGCRYFLDLSRRLYFCSLESFTDEDYVEYSKLTDDYVLFNDDFSAKIEVGVQIYDIKKGHNSQHLDIKYYDEVTGKQIENPYPDE